MAPMELFIDPKSSASLRVLTFVAYKGIEVALRPLSLLRDEHGTPAHRALNPARAVPVLRTAHGVLTQSAAILEWLEELHPEPPTLPADPWQRAQVRAVCGLVACDMHPIANRRVRQVVGQWSGGASVEQWSRHWTEEGMVALEAGLARGAGRFSFGDTPGMADFFVGPQVLNAIRFGCEMAPYPRARAVYEACLEHPAFAALEAAAPTA